MPQLQLRCLSCGHLYQHVTKEPLGYHQPQDAFCPLVAADPSYTPPQTPLLSDNSQSLDPFVLWCL